MRSAPPLWRFWLFAWLFLLASCGTSEIPATITPTPVLRLYHTATPSLTATPPLQPPETAIPTPTPFFYTVQEGDTMSGIALKFGISLDALVAANPDVIPSAMRVGQELRIPTGPEETSREPTPTPVPLTVQGVTCHPTLEGGMWCFVSVRNEYPDDVENLSAQVTLTDADGDQVATQVALLPLDILPPGKVLPLVTFFPPQVPPDARPGVRLLTGVRLLPGEKRYLPAVLRGTLVEIDWAGKTARVQGRVSLPEESGDAGQVWVVAVAYDGSGRVVGVRRWEAEDGVAGGESVPFVFGVSSLGADIARVDVAVEARAR